MVVDLDSPDHTDLVFHALADATRREIVQHALQVEESVSTIARRYPMSFAAVQKHVALLERAGLVSKRRRGREQLVRGEPAGLAAISHLLDHLEGVWRQRIDQFGDVLADTTSQGANR